MTDRWREPLEQWARDRGLDFVPEGLLPPWTRALAAGLGAGTHRAGLVISRTRRSQTSVGGFTKRPERSSHHLCRGVLPGGLDGVLAHHLHLFVDSDSDGESWQARPDTVVVARLPEGARVACELTAAPAGPDVAVGREVDLSAGDAPPAEAPWTEIRGGYHWTVSPAEDPGLLAVLLGAGVEQALAAAPLDTRIELRYGALCVSAPGALTDAVALDALCRVAAALAAGMRRAAALLAPLDPAAPLPAPAATPRSRWIDAGVARVAWDEPPPSVPAAAAAYAAVVAAEAGGVRRKVLKIAAAVALVCALLSLLATVALAKLAGDPPLWTLLVVAVGGPVVAFGLARGVLSMGRDAARAHIELRATPWGIEAFAREHASRRGLVLEDRHAFRRGFVSPVPGIPLKVLRGPLGDGVQGRLVLWLDPTEIGAKRYALLAIAPAGDRPTVAPPAGAPYAAYVHEGALVLALDVPGEGRSGANLDALADAAALLGSYQPLSSG